MTKATVTKRLKGIITLTDSELSANADYIRETVNEALKCLSTATSKTTKKSSTKKKVVPKKITKEYFDECLDSDLEEHDFNCCYNVEIKDGNVVAVKFSDKQGCDFTDEQADILCKAVARISKDIEVHFEGEEYWEEE